MGDYFKRKIHEELEKGNIKPDNKNPYTKTGDTYPITFKDPVSTKKFNFKNAPKNKD